MSHVFELFSSFFGKFWCDDCFFFCVQLVKIIRILKLSFYFWCLFGILYLFKGFSNFGKLFTNFDHNLVIQKTVIKFSRWYDSVAYTGAYRGYIKLLFET